MKNQYHLIGLADGSMENQKIGYSEVTSSFNAESDNSYQTAFPPSTRRPRNAQDIQGIDPSIFDQIETLRLGYHI